MSCTPGTASVVCMSNMAFQCAADGTVTGQTDCAALSQTCVNGSGCQLCRPDQTRCAGANVERCNATGTGYTVVDTCDGAAGLTCSDNTGTCRNACEDAESTNSYIGCDYWSTTMMNSVYQGFAFAVVVTNPNAAATNVTITRGGSPVASMPVAANSVVSVPLPWVDELKSPAGTGTASRSVLVANGAYHIVSTLPVTVFQFNPLEYRLPMDCPAQGTSERPGDNACFSFTNDASLLLPTHVLTGNYLGVARPSRLLHFALLDEDGDVAQNSDGTPAEVYSSTPGGLVVVGADEGPVTVTVTLSANIAGGTGVTAGAPAAVQTYTLNPGDVLQLASADPPHSACDDPLDTEDSPTPCDLFDFFVSCTDRLEYCRVGPEYDLTGTLISATGRVMVLGGHQCAFVPASRFACDHLEESVFPLETWDNEAIVAKTQSPGGRNEPNIVRIISGADNNVITFDPASVAPSQTLARGQYFEFEANASFKVSGTGPILVAQFLVGQNYGADPGPDGEGDPAMSFAIPSAQYRQSYSFLAPSSYPTNFVGVTAPLSAAVMLDGVPISGALTPIGSTGFGSVQLSVPGGAHTMSADVPFGVVVYGFGRYTSYMYPGGLDLEQINPLI